MLRLPAADEPPAEEAHEAPNDNNNGNRYACDRAGGEVGITTASSAIFHEIAEDRSGASWSRAGDTAPDARDASIIGFTRCARAAREECPVARIGPRHRLTALYTSGTAESMH